MTAVVKMIHTDGIYGFARVLDPYTDEPTHDEVYLPKSQLAGLTVGDRITFDIETHNGRRRATRVTRIAEPSRLEVSHEDHEEE